MSDLAASAAQVPLAAPAKLLHKKLTGGVVRARPGLLLCGTVTLAAVALQAAEEAVFGRTSLEALVLAILIGAAVRTAWTPGGRWRAGAAFGAKTLLEVAVVLLGALPGVGTIMTAGLGLLAGIAGVVTAAILLSCGIGQTLRLPRRMAVLVACGNSAMAPVISADSEDASRLRQETDEPAPHLTAGDRPKPGRITIRHLMPWFILGFLALAGVRLAGLIPEPALGPCRWSVNSPRKWAANIPRFVAGLAPGRASPARRQTRFRRCCSLGWWERFGGSTWGTRHDYGIAPAGVEPDRHRPPTRHRPQDGAQIHRPRP